MQPNHRRVSLTETIVRTAVYPFFRLLWGPKLVNDSKFLPIETPCFIYGNHSHNLDPFILNMFTPAGYSTSGVLTQEYFRGGLTAMAMRDIRLLPTRKHLPEPHLIRKIYKKIEDKESIVIYPEGGRRWDGRPLPWIDSTAKIFIRCGVPVYPISTQGSYISWPRWAKYPRPGRMRITVHEPFTFDRKSPFEEALAALKKPIDFDENIVPDEVKPKWAYRPAEGIHRLLYRDPESGANGGVYTKDGTYVTNHAGTFRYKMLPDSTLLNESTSEIITTATLYDKVRTLPIMKDSRGVLLENNVHLHTEMEFPELTPHGQVTASLFEDAVRFTGPDFCWDIDLDTIIHAGIERSSKLQLFQADRMYQLTFSFDGGSALHWQDLFNRLKNNHSPLPLSEPQVKS